MTLTIGRIALDAPLTWTEQVGDPTATIGGSVVPGQRNGLKMTGDLITVTNTLAADALADRMRKRRQLRALMNNTPYKLLGLYVAYSDDVEQSGWYVPNQSSIQDQYGAALATGIFHLPTDLQLVGHPRTHRRGISYSAKDVRLSTTPRDYLKTIYSSDFSTTSTAAPFAHIPSSASDVVELASGSPQTQFRNFVDIAGSPGPGGIYNLADGTALSFEQPEANRNDDDVVIRDRQGQPATEALWEEVYGPDQPLTPGDCPVMDNGICRLRYDATNTPGFRIDVVQGGSWVEQGKVFAEIQPGGTASLVSCSVEEYTPDRAVMKVVIFDTGTTNPSRRNTLYITLQRGWNGPRVEGYGVGGTPSECRIDYTTATADPNNTLMQVTAGNAGAVVATAGSGSALFTDGLGVGTATFTGENHMTLLRQGAVLQPVFSVRSAKISGSTCLSAQAYGTNRNGARFHTSTGPGKWVGLRISYYVTTLNEIFEAESATTLGTGTASTSDAAASNGLAATATRTSDSTLHVSESWAGSGATNTIATSYRVFVRVRTSAGGTLSCYAKTAATTGSTKTTTSTTYVWLDLGEVASTNATLEIHAWITAGTLFVDRVETYVMANGSNTGTANIPATGARDVASFELYETLAKQTIVTR